MKTILEIDGMRIEVLADSPNSIGLTISEPTVYFTVAELKVLVAALEAAMELPK